MDAHALDKFTLKNTPCNISICGDELLIKILKNDPDILADENTPKIKVILFSEILTIKCLNPQKHQFKSKGKLNLKKTLKLPRVAIRTIERCGNHKWKLTTVKLKSRNEDYCKLWTDILVKKLSTEYINLRPKSLLVFINPCGGNGDGQNIYEKRVSPIFEEANIETNVITTDFRHHAKAYVETKDLSGYDGIVAVGGDGMLNEVVNGLICRTQSQNGISLHTKKGNPFECAKFVRSDMKVGVIPAGSTDCVSYVTQGINDAETSALHIVLGDSHPVDVVSLHNSDGLLEQFSMSLNGYGYFGDIIRHSENYRWMGPPRYSLAGVNVFLKNRSYSGEVHYLPADCKQGPKSPSFCRAPCEICQDGLADTAPTPLFTPSISPSFSFTSCETPTHEERSISDAEDSIASTDSSNNDKSMEDDTIDEDEGMFFESETLSRLQNSNQSLTENYDQISTQDKDDLFMTEKIEDDIVTSPDFSLRPFRLDLTKPEQKENWQVIRGDFMAINGVSMSCACEKSPLGMSPYSHLSDGAIDLIIVRSCSRLEFLRFLLAHAGKGNRFDFPFVEVHRVKAFQFIPAPTTPDSFRVLTTPDMRLTPSDSHSPLGGSSGESVHISLEDFSVKYSRSSKKKNNVRGRLKRSQSTVDNPLSTWNSDGEIVRDANMTVRVHRGLILMFCRGVEEL